MSDLLIPSFLVRDVSESLRSLTKNERMSKLLAFLSESLIRSFFCKNERFPQKTDEQIPSPAISHQNDLKNRMNSTFSSYSVILVQLILLFISSWCQINFVPQTAATTLPCLLYKSFFYCTYCTIQI